MGKMVGDRVSLSLFGLHTIVMISKSRIPRVLICLCVGFDWSVYCQFIEHEHIAIP